MSFFAGEGPQEGELCPVIMGHFLSWVLPGAISHFGIGISQGEQTKNDPLINQETPE